MTKMKNPECFDNVKILNQLRSGQEKFNIVLTHGKDSKDTMNALLVCIASYIDLYSVDMSYIGNTLTIKIDEEEK